MKELNVSSSTIQELYNLDWGWGIPKDYVDYRGRWGVYQKIMLDYREERGVYDRSKLDYVICEWSLREHEACYIRIFGDGLDPPTPYNT